MSEINDTKELPEGIFSVNLKFIDQYQQIEPSLKAKYINTTYQKYYFCGVINIYPNHLMCMDKVVIASILQN